MKKLQFLHWIVLTMALSIMLLMIITLMHKTINIKIDIEEERTFITEVFDESTTTLFDTNIPETQLMIKTDTEIETTPVIDIELIITEVETQIETELDTEIETDVESARPSETIMILPLTLIDIYEKYDLEDDAEILAKLMYMEAGGIKSTIERACVAWTVLNRVDKYGTSVYIEVTKPYQFAWRANAPVYADLLELAYDVLARWYLEKETGEMQGRVLPSNYYYFYGDGRHNYFFRMWENKRDPWDYSLPSPYLD